MAASGGSVGDYFGETLPPPKGKPAPLVVGVVGAKKRHVRDPFSSGDWEIEFRP